MLQRGRCRWGTSRCISVTETMTCSITITIFILHNRRERETEIEKEWSGNYSTSPCLTKDCTESASVSSKGLKLQPKCCNFLEEMGISYPKPVYLHKPLILEFHTQVLKSLSQKVNTTKDHLYEAKSMFMHLI